jgi:DNA-binding MarR family transcriptional regulator/L-amino acid N-acyltransferase YncA
MQHISSESVNALRQETRTVVRELGLLKEAYFDIGITLAERHLLLEMASLPEANVGTMAEKLLLDKSSASRLIARAVKKGFAAYVIDAHDKRRRGLQLTDHGRETLAAFEELAQQQVVDALLTLSQEEVESIYRGVTLLAAGLTEARLRKSEEVALKHSAERFAAQGCGLVRLEEADEQPLYEIFRDVVDTGGQFPYLVSSVEEFQRHFLAPQSRVFVCRSADGEVIGGFYIRTNETGVANAAYMVARQFRGRGIGRLLVEASLEIAKRLGYRAMQYNLVLSENRVAIDLYQKLGFQIVATIPRELDQVGYVMCCNLN